MQTTVWTQAIAVTVEDFVRAETDMYFGVVAKQGGFGKFVHCPRPTPIEKQDVVRPNRDTLYSAAVFDLDAGPVAITLPDAGRRFMSMLVIDEDHYTPLVAHGGGHHTLTRLAIGTRYAMVGVRTLVDPTSAPDLKQVQALQKAITVVQKSPGRFDVPDWDPSSLTAVRDALLVLGAGLPDLRRAFGARGHVDPVRHLIGTAMSWGGNPDEAALYLNVTPSRNDGRTVYKLEVKDVPVDAFWSISVYNARGYFEANRYRAYTVSSLTAKKAPDGSVTVQFGGCDGRNPNCLPTMPGWNYLVRLYRPRPELLSGHWTFPEAEPVRNVAVADIAHSTRRT